VHFLLAAAVVDGCGNWRALVPERSHSSSRRPPYQQRLVTTRGWRGSGICASLNVIIGDIKAFTDVLMRRTGQAGSQPMRIVLKSCRDAGAD